jgi:hypothetical protein
LLFNEKATPSAALGMTDLGFIRFYLCSSVFICG